MFKGLLIFLLISFTGSKSWSGPAKPKKSKIGKSAKIRRSSSKSLIKKTIDTTLIDELYINKTLKNTAKKDLQKIADKLKKMNPRLLAEKQNVFKLSKQILQSLKFKKSETESLELLVALVSKQSLSMMNTQSKTQIANFQFLLNSINNKLISSSVLLKNVLKEASEDYVVARQKVSSAKKQEEGAKFLEDLKKRCKS